MRVTICDMYSATCFVRQRRRGRMGPELLGSVARSAADGISGILPSLPLYFSTGEQAFKFSPPSQGTLKRCHNTQLGLSLRLPGRMGYIVIEPMAGKSMVVIFGCCHESQTPI